MTTAEARCLRQAAAAPNPACIDARAPQLVLDIVDDRPQTLGRDVPLLGGLLQTGEQLLWIEVFAPPVLLGDEKRDGFDPLVRGESLPALQALTPAPNRLTDLRVA